MPFYHRINSTSSEGRRTLERLLILRDQLGDEIPARTLDETLLLATWNIRDFDKPTFGRRRDEPIYYIAEIISHFDLVAVQEVYKDLEGLERVMEVLGSRWKYLITDETRGAQGNDERMAFLYDSAKIRFGGLAGEIVLPPVQVTGEDQPVTQLWRTPFVCGFKAGWTDFLLCTVHIAWGSSVANPELRVREIDHVAKFLRQRSDEETAWSQNLILLGDFNIFESDDATFSKITDAGFVVPSALQELPSNALRNRHYDQIAFRVRPGRLDFTQRAGVFDYYQSVFRFPLEGQPNNPQTNDESLYMDAMQPGFDTTARGTPRTEASKRIYFRTYWRTHQMSDHLPMWVELRINYTNEYLRPKLES